MSPEELSPQEPKPSQEELAEGERLMNFEPGATEEERRIKSWLSFVNGYQRLSDPEAKYLFSEDDLKILAWIKATYRWELVIPKDRLIRRREQPPM